MRLAVLSIVAMLAIAAAGCEVVFPLEDTAPGMFRRPPFNGQVTDDSRLRVTQPATVQVGDYIVGTLQSAAFSTEIRDLPNGWDKLADFPDGGCDNAQWHTWVVAGRATEETTLDFTFENNDTFDALFIPYVDVAAVSSIRNQFPMNSPDAGTATFPASVSSPGTIMYVSVMANEQTPSDPAGMTRVSAFGNIVAFDQELPDGELPEVHVEVPANFCLGASQIKVER